MLQYLLVLWLFSFLECDNVCETCQNTSENCLECKAGTFR